jgi:hypothetical protein
VHVDLGSGDARGPYRLARRDPERLFVAVDANLDCLAETAWRASRRDARGGAPNLVCVAADACTLGAELPGIADRVTVVLPWGALLRAVATPEASALESLAALCRPGASVEVVFSHEPGVDPDGVTIAPPEDLRCAYARAGLRVHGVERLGREALREYPTTWAKRLAFGRPREVWQIRARCVR